MLLWIFLLIVSMKFKMAKRWRMPFQKFLVILKLNNFLISQRTEENWVHYLFWDSCTGPCCSLWLSFTDCIRGRGDWWIPNPLLVMDREINKVPICCPKECIQTGIHHLCWRDSGTRQWDTPNRLDLAHQLCKPFYRSRGCSLIATISLEQASSPVSKQLKFRAYNGFVLFVLVCLIFIFFYWCLSILNRGSESLLIE